MVTELFKTSGEVFDFFGEGGDSSNDSVVGLDEYNHCVVACWAARRSMRHSMAAKRCVMAAHRAVKLVTDS